MLLGLDYSPYELMLQLLTKADDPFTGGRSYYSHPNSKEEDKPKIIHQSSATGMQQYQLPVLHKEFNISKVLIHPYY
jgi:2-oxoisovalerate dehydrogenase E1 component